MEDLELRVRRLEIQAAEMNAMKEKVSEIHHVLIKANPSLITRMDRLERTTESAKWTMRALFTGFLGVLGKFFYDLIH